MRQKQKQDKTNHYTIMKITVSLRTAITVVSIWNWTVGASSTNNNNNPSVRALDKFGNLQQLKHAREASLRHGRPIVAAANESTILVVSIGNKPVVTNLSLPQQCNPMAICCSGIKGDANWLISQLQEYTTTIWERYNHSDVSSPAIAYYISKLLLSFQQYDLDQEFQSSINIANPKHEWARPLGVQTMIISLSNPKILMIEPSGRIETTAMKSTKASNWNFGAIGKNSPQLQEKVVSEVVLPETDDTDSMIERLVNLLLLESNVKLNETVEFMIEILNRDNEIERKVIKFRNGKETSSS
jgi:20S proteasome alpha/beta subunit